jgi:hypothetical protein
MRRTGGALKSTGGVRSGGSTSDGSGVDTPTDGAGPS